ncbi:hypothetical protein G7085_11640 [Tessaracoccus sp. HDW20]|uniref:hypothetical protein n=1 Tax=Tessaracoccus coleopterorum TaxID=2714950 RepID=UPI0018D295B3|nr:hypothetical protein [Tessaracoccus coleopterorum]NHB85040.1 hypothetical protein [Tessaracoccus coleopterorum]
MARGETTFTGFPEGLGNARLMSPATDRDSCAGGSLELTLDPGGLGNGSFTGSTTVMLAASDSTAEPIAAELAFDLSQTRPVSQPVLWGVLILVTLLGVAIPVGILYLVKYLTAKIPGNAVLAGTVSGLVDDTRSFTDNGVPIGVANLAVAHLTNRREVSVAGRTLVAKMGASPTAPATSSSTPRTLGRRQDGAAVGRRQREAPAGGAGQLDGRARPAAPGDGPGRGDGLHRPGAPGFNELLEDVRANIRPAVAKLREGLPPERPGAAPSGPADPWSTPQAQTHPDTIPGRTRPVETARPAGRAPGE